MISDEVALQFVDAKLGDPAEWPSILVAYRLSSDFQADWKAEIGRWLMFAEAKGFLHQLLHRVLRRAKKFQPPNSDRDPNDAGYLMLAQELAPAMAAYHLESIGWKFIEWESKVANGDVDFRMETNSGSLCDFQVKAPGRPGKVHKHRVANEGAEESFLIRIDKAIEQLKDCSSPKKLIVIVSQNREPLSWDPDSVMTHLLGSTIYENENVTLYSDRKGAFDSISGRKISGVMLLDFVRGAEQSKYNTTVVLNPWTHSSSVLFNEDFQNAAVGFFEKNVYQWSRNPGRCGCFPVGTKYIDRTSGV